MGSPTTPPPYFPPKVPLKKSLFGLFRANQGQLRPSEGEPLRGSIEGLTWETHDVSQVVSMPYFVRASEPELLWALVWSGRGCMSGGSIGIYMAATTTRIQSLVGPCFGWVR